MYKKENEWMMVGTGPTATWCQQTHSTMEQAAGQCMHSQCNCLSIRGSLMYRVHDERSNNQWC